MMKTDALCKMILGININKTGEKVDNEDEYILKSPLGIGPSIKLPKSMLVKIRDKIDESIRG